MSGYQSELIGQPHCSLRHPDMPKAAYADLWANGQAGKQWDGYVKPTCAMMAVILGPCRRRRTFCNGQIVGFTSSAASHRAARSRRIGSVE